MSAVLVNQPSIVVVTEPDGSTQTVVYERLNVVVADRGIQGSKGDRGVPGPPGDPDQLGYVYHAVSNEFLHRITHNLPYKPGGITVVDSDGVSIIAFAVTHPLEGVTEITFGNQCRPTIYVS